MTTFHTPQGLTAMIRRVTSPRGRRQAGLFSIEGTRLVERAVRAGAPLQAVLVAERYEAAAGPRQGELLAALQAMACPITRVPDEVLAELTEGRDLGLIIGLVELPAPPDLAGLLAAHPAPARFLAAVDIVDPGNAGALTRTAHAAGAAALLAAGVSDPFHPRATRISRGSVFKLPIIEYPDARALLADLRRHEIVLVGADAAGGTPLPRMVWPRRPAAVLMGNEAGGLPDDVLAALDFRITIPMPPGVDSYSVNAAAAIILYAAAHGLGEETST